MKHHITVLLVTLATLSGGAVFAHDDKPHKKKQPAAAAVEEKSFGRAGDRAKINRTITLDMKDEMRFIPSTLNVKQGETIRFVVRNTGKLMHELVIGTMQELQEHSALMKKFPDMEHDEPHMTHVRPGTTGEIVWQFSRGGQFHYACLIAGHFEAGMVGSIAVAPATPNTN